MGLLAAAQSCENYGFSNGSTCACPVGFGGSTCSQPGCGGTIFQGLQRPLASVPSGSFANLTASNCSCQTGWTGLGCNVCETTSACQSGYSAVVNTSSSFAPNGLNNTVVCNTSPRVYASAQMSCSVVNPTLQALYPLDTTLNLLRTFQPSLSLLPNVTGFGNNGTVYAQLFYAGVEQFYCKADTCTQQVSNGTQGSTDWSCQDLQCTCRSKTSFCGASPATDLTDTINGLTGSVNINCQDADNSTGTATCNFQQTLLNQLFGSSGLVLQSCSFGECVTQNTISGTTLSDASTSNGGKSLSGGVIAGLAVIGALVALALAFLFWGLFRQRVARKAGYIHDRGKRATIAWQDVSCIVPKPTGINAQLNIWSGDKADEDRTILDSVSGKVRAGQMMAILGPSGAGKTTLVEILANKAKSAVVTGTVEVSSSDESEPLRIGFVPQQDILPPLLTVHEALLFASRLRLPEGISDTHKRERVDEIMEKLGISHLRNVRIGHAGGSGARGISGGEMRRVSIGLELIADPDILILDEPTSGLDSVSASRVASVLHSIAHDPINPIPIITSIHQPSSQLYQKFDTILLLSHGRVLYAGQGSLTPAEYFSSLASEKGVVVPACPPGYNIADYLLEVASDPPVGLFNLRPSYSVMAASSSMNELEPHSKSEKNSIPTDDDTEKNFIGENTMPAVNGRVSHKVGRLMESRCATTFLTQLQVLSGREWKILKRDKTLFLTHVAVSSVIGVFVGGMYFHTGINIAGFQSRIGCLFFLGALIAFSSLSALYNVVEIRSLFVRERSSFYYSPTAWLLSRLLFDVIPLRIIPTIIVSTITYWMAGLSPHAANFFKFLFILVLYTLVMTLYNFLLGTFFSNGGIAILLSALSALYQMTFAGFFVHLGDIPPVLRWLQWTCPLKFTLEALSVNEVGSGLMIEDTIQGVPVDISASVIMQLLFGFGLQNYYRDVLVLFAYIAGFGLLVITVVWWKVRERR